MRRSFAVPTLVLLVLAAFGMGALSSGRASADGDPQIVLLTETIDHVEEPTAGIDPPTALRFGYVLMVQDRFGVPQDMYPVLDDHIISPSDKAQTFEANQSNDPDFGPLVSGLDSSVGDGAPSFSFERNGLRQFWSAGWDASHQIARGAHIDHFTLTVAPFTIEEIYVDPFHRSAGVSSTGVPAATIGPYYVYRMVTSGPAPTIQAWGSPPPGDANCDAAINSIDALVMLQHGAGLLDSLSCAKAADVTHDGTVDARDAQLVLQFNAGLIQQL